MSFHRKRASSCLLVVIIVFFAASHRTAAQDLISSRRLIEDASGKLTIDDVVRRAGTEIGPAFKKGTTDWAYWVRLQVHAPAHGSKVVLFIRPSYLGEVRLFEPDASNPSGWTTRITGNRYPFADRDRHSTSLGFVVNVSAPEITYYFRIKTRSAFSLQVEGMEPEQADRKDHQRDLFEVFFVTCMAMLLIWATQSYLMDRQAVVGWFAFHQAVYTLFGIVATGYLAPLNPARFPQLVDGINAILYMGIGVSCVLFCRELFKPYQPAPLLKRILDLLPWSFPLLLIVFATGHYTLAINVNAALIKLSLLLFVVTAFSLRVDRVPRRRILQIFFLVILVFNLLFWYAARFTQLAGKVNLSAIQALVFDGLVFAALFAWVLHANARQLLREGHESAIQLLLMQKQLEIEHELKKQMEIQAQTDYLTGLCNRRHFIDLAECELTRSIRYGRPLTLLVIDIDHFKKINDAWGHATGDLVLLQVSQLIRESLRCNDVFARTGGEEFGVLLPETAESEALNGAQRVCSCVADAIIRLAEPERIQVSVSIGLAGVHGRGISLDALMDEADQAMYCAKQAGRNCVCISDAGIDSAIPFQRT